MSQVGYVLSPPNPKYAKAKKDETTGNIVVVWKRALGAVDYAVYSSSSAGGSYSRQGTVDDATTIAGQDQTMRQYIHTGIPRDSSVFYKITSEGRDGTNAIIETPLIEVDPIETLPARVQNVVASDNLYVSEMKGKENGNEVYPIKISWDSVPGAITYSVWKAPSTNSLTPPEDKNYVEIHSGAVSDENFEHIDESDTARPGEYYYYKVKAHNSLGGAGDISDADRGYGALTNFGFTLEFKKIENDSHTKLTLIHKSGTDALGSETHNGLRGTVSYNISQSGLGGGGPVTYSNYVARLDPEDSTKAYLTLNGSNNTSADANANGSQTFNYTVSGMYSGSLSGKLTISGGSASGGSYSVTQSSGVSAGTVEYNSL